MHPIILLAPLLLSLPSPAHATPAQLITSTNALTKRADTIDAVVVALTPQTPLTTAHQISPPLQNLTTALTTTLTLSTPTPPTTDPVTRSDVLDTYGLFANPIWELMDDYTYQRTNLIGVFDLKGDIYSQLTSFDSAFQDLSTFTTAMLDNVMDKIDMGFYVGNTTLTIDLALAAFAP